MPSSRVGYHLEQCLLIFADDGVGSAAFASDAREIAMKRDWCKQSIEFAAELFLPVTPAHPHSSNCL